MKQNYLTNQIPADRHVMIIGAMKSGTTSLFNYLQTHPEICPARNKEPEYFTQNQSHGSNTEHYQDNFDFKKDVHKYALEASTGYTKYPSESGVAKRIHEYGLRPKFIYIVRDPFERIISHYNYMSQVEGWDLDIDSPNLINVSKYGLQLDQFNSFFPRDKILILDFEDLKNSPKDVLKSVYSFLAIAPDFYPHEYNRLNQTKINSQLEEKIKSRYSKLARFFPKPVVRSFKGAIRNHVTKKRLLTETQRTRIQVELQEDMQKFKEKYSFDVSKWGFYV